MNVLLSLLAAFLASAAPHQQVPVPKLSITEFIVSDTAKYESFHLKVINESDSIVVIEQAQPSCGCILVTVQRSLALRGQPGDIYIAITSQKVSPLQPYTVDIYTNRNHTSPLRLYIRRAEPSDADAAHNVTPVIVPHQDTVPTSPKPLVPKKKKHNR